MVILKKEFSYFDTCKVIRLFFCRYSKIRLLCYVINNVTCNVILYRTWRGYPSINDVLTVLSASYNKINVRIGLLAHYS